ncbi:MAG: dipeptide epimerase [Sphingomonas bacterium]|uniref:N-acetyl-D-Glu racemase DgcA n=1 Tax=Sphingomonas bacterium TaxID=1895847 RepID=UPI00262F786B|nr:N-acetyl-D-Glu racemase DgcA [Sphingomonas bacterium]MDB5706915.1 dipeptide epimerase [Sphingomonas bacterium]
MLRHVHGRVELWPLAAPFRISRGVKTVAEVVTVELEQGAHIGRGEAVPYARYGESSEGVLRQIETLAPMLAAGLSRTELRRALPPGAARNAIDCALWDLEARLSGQSVAVTAAAPLSPVTTALTVGLDTPDAMADAAAALTGSTLVKVKVDAQEPEACLNAVRRALPDAALIVDPNESWDMALLERLQPMLRDLRIAFVEQPLPAEDDACLEGFEPLVPICADESCHTAEDLPVLERRYGMINIKLDKTGGLTEALELYDAARARGMGIMVGCMVSTSLSIAPALHIAARADFADLDGPWWLKEDRPGGVTMQGSTMLPPAQGFWGTL